MFKTDMKLGPDVQKLCEAGAGISKSNIKLGPDVQKLYDARARCPKLI